MMMNIYLYSLLKITEVLKIVLKTSVKKIFFMEVIQKRQNLSKIWPSLKICKVDY